MVDDLVCSPKLVMDPLSTAVISNHSNPVATSNMDRESLEYFILSNSRRHSAVHRPCVPGEIPWLKSPANERGYAQYQDIDHTTPYGRLTLEMCAIAQVDYNYYYRQATSLSSYHIPQTSLLPNPNAESEYVKTNHIFSHWVDGILTQFQTRYPRIFDCLKYPAAKRGTLCQKRYISCIHVSRACLACSLAKNSGDYMYFDLQVWYGMISCHGRRVLNS
jgi:hypothetical protein